MKLTKEQEITRQKIDRLIEYLNLKEDEYILIHLDQIIGSVYYNMYSHAELIDALIGIASTDIHIHNFLHSLVKTAKENGIDGNFDLNCN